MAVSAPRADREQLPVGSAPPGHLLLNSVLELNPVTSLHNQPARPGIFGSALKKACGPAAEGRDIPAGTIFKQVGRTRTSKAHSMHSRGTYRHPKPKKMLRTLVRVLDFIPLCSFQRQYVNPA